jgi:tetratricopeptide (TPR) repeat protein
MWFRCTAAALSALLVASPPQRRASSWRESVNLYLAGGFDQAVEPLRTLDKNQQREVALAREAVVLDSLNPFKRSRLKVSLAIATELTIFRGDVVVCAAHAAPPGWPADIPRLMKSGELVVLEDPSRGPLDYLFLVSWYRLATAYNQGRGDLANARLCIDTAPPEVKRDPEILLAYGAILETGAALQIEEGASESRWQQDVRLAEQAYLDAVSAAADLLEARLRLGRVLTQLGRYTEAMELLEPLREAGDPRIAYLARMFSGLTQLRAGMYTAARLEFSAAEGSIAGLPSPPVASALAAYLQDDRDNARRLVLDAARRPATGTVDPWAWYTKGTASRTAGYLHAVRITAIR